MEPLLLTVEEAAAALKIGRTKLYELKSQNKIRAIKIGKSLRFRPKDLEDYVAKCAKKAAAEEKKRTFNMR